MKLPPFQPLRARLAGEPVVEEPTLDNPSAAGPVVGVACGAVLDLRAEVAALISVEADPVRAAEAVLGFVRMVEASPGAGRLPVLRAGLGALIGAAGGSQGAAEVVLGFLRTRDDADIAVMGQADRLCSGQGETSEPDAGRAEHVGCLLSPCFACFDLRGELAALIGAAAGSWEAAGAREAAEAVLGFLGARDMSTVLMYEAGRLPQLRTTLAAVIGAAADPVQAAEAVLEFVRTREEADLAVLRARHCTLERTPGRPPLRRGQPRPLRELREGLATVIGLATDPRDGAEAVLAVLRVPDALRAAQRLHHAELDDDAF